MAHLKADQPLGMFDGAHAPAADLVWSNFLDPRFFLDSLGILVLAVFLGAAIGYHPSTRRTIDKLSEADLPHIYVMYAVIGAIIGVAVREFGTVVGVVVFGIGGLMRFKSSTDSTRDTVRLIVVTLAGLIAGLGLLHFAVMIIIFTFIMIWLFDSNPPFRIRIEGLKWERCGACADAYREMLKAHGCTIIAEHHSTEKERIEFVFRLPRRGKRESLEAQLHSIAEDLRGEVDWEAA